MEDNIIKLENLTMIYDDFRLDNINLELPKGVIMGIVGKNGSGKSTLINCISNYEDKYYGKIFIDNNAIWQDEAEYIRSFGILRDGFKINMFFTGKKVAKLLDKNMDNFDMEYFDNTVKKLNINTDKTFRKMSKGNIAKLNLVLVMSLKRDLLILDEPTLGMDPLVKNDVMEVLQDYIEDGNKTIILATHETTYLDKIADYILFLNDGKVKMFDVKENIINNHYIFSLPSNEFTNEIKQNVVYFDKKSLHVTCITKDVNFLTKNNISYTKPSIEDIMIAYVGSEVQTYE